MTSRLHALDATRSARLSQASETVRRRIAFAAVASAYAATGAQHRPELFTALDIGQFGDSPLRNSLDQARREVRAAAEREPAARYDRLAFAYDAAWWALDLDPEAAVQEAVYLAHYAVPDGTIAALVDQILAG